jgi:hypothetical protein
MNETTYIYIVHSDIDENNIYAEFPEEQAAIEYARKNASELTYVDKVEVLLDDDGDILDEYDSETIWVYSDEEAPAESEEDYWDMLAAEYEEQEANKHDLGDTTWFEGLDTNDLVETLEENETEVECKECFDLFPKTDCVKVAFGYICPTCAKCEVADEDIFKIDFPEYEKFSSENEMIPGEPNPEPMPDNSPNPDPMPETEETENNPISDPEEVVPFLVKDEEEAIAGYDEATEVIQDSDIENKEEILDTLDHIKEEEKEHIEELQDLEVDTNTKDENDPISNPEEIETPEDDTAELEELFDVGLNVGIDGGENNNVSVLSSHEPKKEGEEELKELFDANVNLSLDGGTGNDVSVLSPLGGVGLGEAIESADYSFTLSDKISEELLYRALVEEGVLVSLEAGDTGEVGVSFSDGGVYSDTTLEITEYNGRFSATEYYTSDDGDYKEGDTIIETDSFETLYAALQQDYPEVFIGSESLVEHVNEEHAAIEADQELEGTDNAVVKCKVADVVTHSEDEKPVDCEGKKKPLEKPLTEETHAKYAKPEGDRKEAYNNALKYAKKDNVPYIYGYSGTNGKFFALDQPVKVTGDIVEKEKEFRNRYKNCKVVYVAYPDKAFMEGYQKFTPEEMEEYGIDEDGNSIEGYDEYVRCTWCEDIFTKDMCGFEADFGWLCDRCQMAISSRGERLSMIINPTEDDFKRVMTEQVSMTSAELIDKYGTDDIDLINAGKEPEERVELKEEAPDYDLTEVNKLLSEIRGENKKKSIHMR